MKRLIIIIIVLLVVAGGGAGGLVMLGIVRNPFQPKPAANAETPVAESSNGFKAPSTPLPLVKVADLIIPVIIDEQVRRQVTISMRLLTTTAGKAHVTDSNAPMPKFRDALLQDLLTYFQDYFARNDAIDVEAIRKKALAHANQIFGDDVTDVLMVNVYETGAAAGKGTFTSDE